MNDSTYPFDDVKGNSGKKGMMESCNLKRNRLSADDEDEEQEQDWQRILASSRKGNSAEQHVKRFRMDGNFNPQCEDERVSLEFKPWLIF